MKRAPPCCGNCRFSTEITTESNPDTIICRRYPPTVLDSNNTAFPLFRPDGWCGEYKSKENSRA